MNIKEMIKRKTEWKIKDEEDSEDSDQIKPQDTDFTKVILEPL